jgi:hypothetical protein
VIVDGVPIRHRTWIEPLREPGDLCYSLAMDNEQTTAVSAQTIVEISQNAITGLIEAFSDQHANGHFETGSDAMRWLEAYQSGVMAVRF